MEAKCDLCAVKEPDPTHFCRLGKCALGTLRGEHSLAFPFVPGGHAAHPALARLLHKSGAAKQLTCLG
jgi:hypothetical protein